jgi:hypothetical protein
MINSYQETDNVGVVVFGDDRAIVEGAGLTIKSLGFNRLTV